MKPLEKFFFLRHGSERRIEVGDVWHVFGYRGLVPATLCGDHAWHSDRDMPGEAVYRTAITCERCSEAFATEQVPTQKK